MRHIIILVEQDRKGVIADISTKLGNERINIESISASVIGAKGLVILSVGAKDYDNTIRLLKSVHYTVMPSEFIILDFEDRPGQLSLVSQTLFDNDINIESIHLITKHGEKALYAVKVDNPPIARKLLGEYLFQESL